MASFPVLYATCPYQDKRRMPLSARTGRGLPSHEQVCCVAMRGRAKATHLRIVRLERPQHFLLQGGNNTCIKEKAHHIDSDLLKSEPSSPVTDQQVFHQYLLTFARKLTEKICTHVSGLRVPLCFCTHPSLLRSLPAALFSSC
jgi:hypothetical protein